LGNYISLEEADIALSAKADLSVLTNDYVTKYHPEFNLTQSDRLNEEQHALQELKVRLTTETASSGHPVSWANNTNMENVLDERYKLITESQNEIEEIQTNKADTVDSVF